jgi:hypothetical protein
MTAGESCPNLGIHYQAMVLLPVKLHGLSTTTTTALYAFDTDFASQEQGGVVMGMIALLNLKPIIFFAGSVNAASPTVMSQLCCVMTHTQ